MTRSGYAILGAAAARVDDIPATPIPRPSDAEARNSALAYLHSLVGTPYIWASKDPQKGLDCSGAYVVSLEHSGQAKPGARFRYGSADLHRILKPTSNPKPGDAAFYGSGGKVSHVMMVTGDGRVLGATGGGRGTKTVEEARAIGAAVKYKPIDYRKDFISFGEAPSVNDPLGGSSSTRLDTSDSREDRIAFIGWGLTMGLLAGLAGLAAWWFSEKAAK